MKIAVAQYDDRPFGALGQLAPLIGRNSKYAELHGYEYAFVNKLGADVPPFWAKVHITAHYLRAGYDAVLWLDTDAVVHDLDMTVPRFFAKDEVFVYAPDNPVWPSPFNAGIFMCRGSRGLDLMEEWVALYQPDQWEKVEGQWKSKDGVWAGVAYEQGSFIANLLPKYADSGLLRRLEWEVLQSPYPINGSYTLHFSGPYKLNIPIYATSISGG